MNLTKRTYKEPKNVHILEISFGVEHELKFIYNGKYYDDLKLGPKDIPESFDIYERRYFMIDRSRLPKTITKDIIIKRHYEIIDFIEDYLNANNKKLLVEDNDGKLHKFSNVSLNNFKEYISMIVEQYWEFLPEEITSYSILNRLPMIEIVQYAI